jgi:hypothetical protein
MVTKLEQDVLLGQNTLFSCPAKTHHDYVIRNRSCAKSDSFEPR